MTYIRKTRDYYSIQQYTGREYGWEEVNAEDTWKDAKQSLKEYRENQPEYPVRARRKREKIENPAVICPQCNQPVWDVAFASKLNKCWNCGLAFDSPEAE